MSALAGGAPVVLVVDDAEAKRYRFVTALRSAGYDVIDAASGAEAIERLSAAPVDVVILDVNLPDMSGFDVSGRVKDHPATRAIPVLLVSATFVDAGSRSIGLRRGGDAYLVEPIEPVELIATVESLLRYSAARRRAELLTDQLTTLHRVTLALHTARTAEDLVVAVRRGARELLGPRADAVLTARGATRLGLPVASDGADTTAGGPLDAAIASAVTALAPVEPVVLGPTGTASDRSWPGVAMPTLVVPVIVRSEGVVAHLVVASTKADPPVDADRRVVAAQYAVAVGVSYTNVRATVRERAMAALVRRMSAASTIDEAAEAVTAAAADVVGARYAGLALRDRYDPTVVRLLLPADIPTAASRRFVRLAIDDPFHACVAIRERRLAVTDESSADDDLADARRLAGIRTGASLPLAAEGGWPLGALTLAWADDVVIDDELTARLETLADICSRGVERALAHETDRRHAIRSAAGARMARELATARTVNDVWNVVARLAAPAAEASMAWLSSGRPPAETPVTTGSADRAMAVDDALARSGIVEVITPVYLGSLAAATPAVEGTDAHPIDGPDCSVAVLPLDGAVGPERVLLVVTWNTRIGFNADERSTLAAVAQVIARTLDRVRLNEAEHGLVGEFQRMALRPVPTVDRLVSAARYRPAASLERIGGDFYDGLVLDDDRLAVVVGDVTGHGLGASADMVRIRTKLHTLVSIGTPLGRVFELADRAIATEPEGVLASAVVAVVDPVGGRIEHVSAGHPPMLLRTPDGRVSVLEGGRRRLLGMSGGAIEPAVVDFPPGSSLLLYTDGLIERRSESIDVGIGRLARAFAQTTDVDALLARMLGESSGSDDVVLVVVGHERG